MRRTKEQKGITLIALIITIVVLLILAVVAIDSIQDSGIVSRAKDTATTYNDAVVNEQQTIQNYLEYLDKNNVASKTYKAYKIGDEVKIVKDGVEHNFYVIKDDGEAAENVLLLAKQNIIADKNNANYLTQSASAGTVAFSTESYWGSVTSPYDIKEETFPIPESHIAAKAAYDYGAKIGGKGRLMTYTEADKLATSHSTMIYGDETNGYLYYWLGSAGNTYGVCYVNGDFGFIDGCDDYDFDDIYGVRPVIEISKTKLQ